MTTSITAEGKIRLAINQGKSIPEGWILDNQGNPTTNPNDLKTEPPGDILPLGGGAGHKGYALGFMIDILAGTLSGAGCAAGERAMRSNGLLFTVYDIGQFTEMETFYDEVETLARHVRTSRLAPGVSEILIPGELEARAARQRARDGIAIDDTTWRFICEEARLLGVDVAE